jgi:hypothetical protein
MAEMDAHVVRTPSLLIALLHIGALHSVQCSLLPCGWPTGAGSHIVCCWPLLAPHVTMPSHPARHCGAVLWRLTWPLFRRVAHVTDRKQSSVGLLLGPDRPLLKLLIFIAIKRAVQCVISTAVAAHWASACCGTCCASTILATACRCGASLWCVTTCDYSAGV